MGTFNRYYEIYKDLFDREMLMTKSGTTYQDLYEENRVKSIDEVIPR